MKLNDCCKPPFNYKQYASTHIGIDNSNGTYADVTIEKCTICGTLWIKYAFEIEGISRSGQWYRTTITPEETERITTTTALEFIEKSENYFCGGSYFDSHISLGSGKIVI